MSYLGKAHASVKTGAIRPASPAAVAKEAPQVLRAPRGRKVRRVNPGRKDFKEWQDLKEFPVPEGFKGR